MPLLARRLGLLVVPDVPVVLLRHEWCRHPSTTATVARFGSDLIVETLPRKYFRWLADIVTNLEQHPRLEAVGVDRGLI